MGNVVRFDRAEFINLTPHDVHIKRGDGSVLVVGSSWVLRVDRSDRSQLTHDFVDGVKVATLGGYHFNRELPPERDGVYYVVSLEVILELAASGESRSDFLYSAAKVRDRYGKVTGCTMLARLTDGS